MYKLSETAARHADRPKYWCSESCLIDKWTSQPLLLPDIDLVYHSIYRPFSARCIFGDHPSLPGASYQNCHVSETRDVPKETVDNWNCRCSIMFRSYFNTLELNSDCWGWYRLQWEVFKPHLPLGLTQYSCCPVHAVDVDVPSVVFAGWMIELVEDHIVTEMDTMYSMVLRTCYACCTISCFAILLPPAYSTPNAFLRTIIIVG